VFVAIWTELVDEGLATVGEDEARVTKERNCFQTREVSIAKERTESQTARPSPYSSALHNSATATAHLTAYD
jgi:hypothetical protein